MTTYYPLIQHQNLTLDLSSKVKRSPSTHAKLLVKPERNSLALNPASTFRSWNASSEKNSLHSLTWSATFDVVQKYILTLNDYEVAICNNLNHYPTIFKFRRDLYLNPCFLDFWVFPSYRYDRYFRKRVFIVNW